MQQSNFVIPFSFKKVQLLHITIPIISKYYSTICLTKSLVQKMYISSELDFTPITVYSLSSSHSAILFLYSFGMFIVTLSSLFSAATFILFSHNVFNSSNVENQ